MKAPPVYAAVLNWNLKAETEACLRSLVEMDYPDLQVILVDNGSTDGSADYLRERFPDITILENQENRGYAAGLNPGLALALEQGAAFILLANNDTVADRAMLSHLVEVAAADPRIGIAGPMILYYGEPQRLWYLGARLHPIIPVPLGLGAGQVDRGQFREPEAVDIVSGCGMLIKREVVERIGLFDPRFFLYYEDSDYCLRAREAGFRIVFVPRARMWHKVSASTRRDPAIKHYHHARGRVLFYRRHSRGLHRWLIGPYLALQACYAMALDLKVGRPDLVAPFLRGLRDGLREPLGDEALAGTVELSDRPTGQSYRDPHDSDMVNYG